MERTSEPEIRLPESAFRTLAIEAFRPPRLDLYGAVLTLARHKLWIAAGAVAGALLAGGVALTLPPVYSATAVILPPPPQRPGLAAFLGQMTPAIGAIAAGGDLMRSPSELYIALLSSRSVADGVAESQRLAERYGTPTRTQTRKGLAGHTHFTAGKDTLVRITVEDEDPQAAAAIANAYVDQLYQLTSRFAVAESAQRRTFYERQVAEVKRDLAAAEEAMRDMQEKTGMLQVSSQVEVVIRTVAQLRAEITAREVMLEGIQAGATDRNPDVVRLRTEIGSLRARLRQLESSGAAADSGHTVIPVGKVPGAGLEYLRALRNLRYQETLFEVLGRQFEAARLDEAKQATVVQVVDTAVPPELPSGPRRVLLTALGTLSAALLTAAALLAHRSLGEPGRAERLRLLSQALWRGR